MFFIIALQAVLSLVNACAAVKTALVATIADHKARSTAVSRKSSTRIEHVHYNITTVGALKEAVLRQLHHTTPRGQQLLLTQHAPDAPLTLVANKQGQVVVNSTAPRDVCAGLVYQHAILHLHVPEDLLAGMDLDFRILQQGGILIPSFEQLQLGEEITPPEPHEEPTYFKRFRLVIDFRILLQAGVLIPSFEECQLREDVMPPGPHEEPNYVKPRRANAPRHIDFAPIDKPVSEEFQQAVWEPIGGIDIHEKIALYQARVDSGQSTFPQESDVPEGPDYVTHHMFENAYCWNLWNQEHERYPQGVEERLRTNPQQNEEVLQLRLAAEEYRAKYPIDFGRFFPGALDCLDVSDDEESAVKSNALSPSRPSSTPPFPTLTYPSLSPAMTPKLVPNSRRFSNDSGYSSGDDYGNGYVTWDDPATILVVIDSRRQIKRWSDMPGDANDLTHESCISLVDFATKKAAAEISQSPPYPGWSATAEYDALEALGPLGYDQRLYGPLPQLA